MLGTSSSSMALQHPAEDKVAYLHDGSLLIGYYDGGTAVVDLVKNPSTSPVATRERSFSGSEVSLFTQPGASSTDIWIQVGAELGGSPLEQVQHGTYDGSTFTWNAVTTIPGAVSPGRQDPSITWTGKWVIATWWDDTMGSNSDNVFMNWTTDKTAQAGWQASATLLTSTGQNSVQVHTRHSTKLGATIVFYGAHCNLYYRSLLDSKTDPSVSDWTPETLVDGADDCEGDFGGPQVAIDENSGTIHMFKAVTSSNGPSWSGITYWKGTPDAVPMSIGSISWSSRLVIDSSSVSSSDPPDVAGAVDSSGKVYVVWVTSVSSGAMKYVTLTSPYTSHSAAVTISTSGSQPRYPHMPAQESLSGGYVPLIYQSGAGSPYNIVLDTSSVGSSAPPPSPSPTPSPGPTPLNPPNGLAASASPTPEVDLSWNASTSPGVTGYDIYRDGSATALASVPGSTLAYADKAVMSSTTYSYTVDATDSAGNHSAQTPPVTVSTSQAWSSLGGLMGSGIGASSWGSNRVDAFVEGTDGGLWQNTWTGGAWSGWTQLDGIISGGPAAVDWSAGRIDVFARGQDRGLYHRYSDGGSWSGWENLGHTLAYGPTVASWGPQRLDIFVVGLDHQLWHKCWNGQSWGPWEPLGGILTSQPAAVAWGPNQIDIVARGADNQLWHLAWTGNAWSGWAPLGGLFNYGPAIASCASGHLDVYGVGQDYALWHDSWNGSQWSGWQSMGGTWTAGPGAICEPGTNVMQLFERAPDSSGAQSSTNGT